MKIIKFFGTVLCILLLTLFSASCLSPPKLPPSTNSTSQSSSELPSPSSADSNPAGSVEPSQSSSPSSTTPTVVPWTGSTKSSIRYVNEDLTVDPEWRYVSLRSGPDGNTFSEICRIQPNELVDFFGNTIVNGMWWAFVKYQGKEGYLPSHFLNNGNAPMIEWTGSMTAETWYVEEDLSAPADKRHIRMRNGPGTEFLSILEIPQKGPVSFYGTTFNAKNDEVWAYVQYKGQFGWAYRDFLTTKLATGAPSTPSSSSEFPVGVWEQLPLYEGMIRSLVIDSSNSQTLYAGTGSNGVFKSTNGGVSWVESSGVLANSNVRCLVIDPSDSQTLYAGIDDSGLFKSSDGGVNWSISSNGLGSRFDNRFEIGVLRLAIDSSNPQSLYAVTDEGWVFNSTNGGASWGVLSSKLTDLFVFSLVIDPRNTQTLYAGTMESWVFKSSDGGFNWVASSSELTNSIVRCLAIDPNNPQTLYAGTHSGGVWKSSDGGASWANFSGGLTDLQVPCLAIDTAGILFAGTGDGLFRLVP